MDTLTLWKTDFEASYGTQPTTNLLAVRDNDRSAREWSARVLALGRARVG